MPRLAAARLHLCLVCVKVFGPAKHQEHIRCRGWGATKNPLPAQWCTLKLPCTNASAGREGGWVWALSLLQVCTSCRGKPVAFVPHSPVWLSSVWQQDPAEPKKPPPPPRLAGRLPRYCRLSPMPQGAWQYYTPKWGQFPPPRRLSRVAGLLSGFPVRARSWPDQALLSPPPQVSLVPCSSTCQTQNTQKPSRAPSSANSKLIPFWATCWCLVALN